MEINYKGNILHVPLLPVSHAKILGPRKIAYSALLISFEIYIVLLVYEQGYINIGHQYLVIFPGH